MSFKVLTEHHLRFLSLIRVCTCSSESTLVKCNIVEKSHVAAQCIDKIKPSPQIILLKKKKKKKKKTFIYLIIG